MHVADLHLLTARGPRWLPPACRHGGARSHGVCSSICVRTQIYRIGAIQHDYPALNGEKC